MNLEEFVSTHELCERYRVEHTFIRSLSDSGLIEVVEISHQEYIHCDKLSEFEKMRRLHYDLEINVEGLEAIQHLLEQVKHLQKKNRQLRTRLNLYE